MATHSILKNKIKLSRLIKIVESSLSFEEQELETAKTVFQSLIDLRLLDTRKVDIDLEFNKETKSFEVRG